MRIGLGKNTKYHTRTTIRRVGANQPDSDQDQTNNKTIIQKALLQTLYPDLQDK